MDLNNNNNNDPKTNSNIQNPSLCQTNDQVEQIVEISYESPLNGYYDEVIEEEEHLEDEDDYDEWAKPHQTHIIPSRYPQNDHNDLPEQDL